MKGRLSHKKIYMLHRLINGKGDLIGKIMSSTGKCSSEYCFMLMLVSAADDSCLFRMRLWREYHGYINFWRIYNKCHIYIVTKCIWCVTLIVNYIKLRYNKCHIHIVITCIWCVTLMVNYNIYIVTTCIWCVTLMVNYNIYIVTTCIWCITLMVNYNIYIVTTCIWCVTLMVNYNIYIVTTCIWCVTLMVNYNIYIVTTCIWCVTLMVNCIKLSHFLSWFCIFVILHIRHVHSKIIGRSVVLLSWSMRWLVGWFFGV